MRLEVNTVVRVLDFVGGEEVCQVQVIDFDFIGQLFKHLVEVRNVRILRHLHSGFPGDWRDRQDVELGLRQLVPDAADQLSIALDEFLLVRQPNVIAAQQNENMLWCPAGEFLDIHEGERERRAARGDNIGRIHFVQIGQRPQDGITKENTVPERGSISGADEIKIS